MPVPTSERKQTLVRLPPDLKRRVQHTAIDVGESQQEFIERSIRERLARVGGRGRRPR